MTVPLGEVASIGAAVCWAVGLTLFARDVRAIGARAVNLFKGMVASVFLVITLLILGWPTIPTGPGLYLALSGFIGLAIGDTLLFFALGRLGAHRTALFGCVGPILTAIAGWLFLQEALSIFQVGGILLAAWGVALVVYKPSASEAARGGRWLGVAAGTASAVCQSVGTLVARVGLRDVDPMPATLLRVGAATLALLVWAAFRRDLVPDLHQLTRPAPLRRLVLASFVGSFAGLWLMQVGIANTSAAVANALHSTTPLFTLPIALFFLRERLGARVVTGSVVAVAGVTLLILAGALS